ncbi:MAG: PEP-CTERM sorting domain-containing protein, partial [Terriglobia bacterium]
IGIDNFRGRGSFRATVTGYAYETDLNRSIRAGQTSDVPEPGTLSLLALGAVGLAVLRRKQVVAQRS